MCCVVCTIWCNIRIRAGINNIKTKSKPRATETRTVCSKTCNSGMGLRHEDIKTPHLIQAHPYYKISMRL